MPLKKSVILIIATLLTLSACKKSSSDDPRYTGVYVSGYIQSQSGSNIAVYWKNGILTRLTDSSLNSYATAITVRGKDIYVAGLIRSYGGTPKAGYWKNGFFTPLGNAGLQGWVSAIAVNNNNDVYVAGTTTNQLYQAVPTYWKNGVPHVLTDSSGVATGRLTSLTLNGNDIFVAGTVISGNYDYPIYWKNDQAAYLTGEDFLNVNGIMILNTDIYAIGTSITNGAVYWKDDFQTALSGNNFASDANAITSSGNDVYIVGAVYIRSSNTREATYWKNNIPVDIGNIQNGTTTGIAVSGNDVYSSGSYFPPETFDPTENNEYDGKALYWKNNNPVKLSNNVSMATGIFVVKQ